MKMARSAIIEAVILTQSWRTSINRSSFPLFSNRQKFGNSVSNLICRYRIVTRVRDFCSGRRINNQNSFRDENISSSPSIVNENIKESTQEVDLEAISDTSKTERNVGQTTNTTFGSTLIDHATGEWLTLDQKVNTYPSVRRFTAIGLGGDDFVKSMVLAVESVIQHPVPQGHVTKRVSSGGKYVSVNIGPIHVVSREQIQWSRECRWVKQRSN